MPTTATKTWRSPLSILIGAKRNDDSDLELREDSLLSSPPPPPPTTPGAESSNGIAAYIPFNYFGLTSPAPDDRHNGEVESMTSSSAHPPLGAFPPPITTPPCSERDNLIDDHDNNNDHEYKATHPFYKRVSLTDPSGDENDLEEDNDQTHTQQNLEQIIETDETKENKWFRQKAIIGTTFNFTNSIIGAGAMGLGGAFAASGGLISILCLIGFAYLTKLSLDLIVDLSSSRDIINRARHNTESGDDNSDTSSYYDAPKFNEFNGEKEKASESIQNCDERGEGSVGQQYNNSTPQTESDSSPLMAQEEGIESKNEPNDHSNSHPLLLPHERERYDSLVMDLTQPRRFSPLLMNISTDNTPQPDSLTRNSDIHGKTTSFVPPCTYEELGKAAYGSYGRLAVLAAKFFYSFGCLIAYVVVVRDNFGPAMRRIMNSDNGNWLNDDNFLAFWVSALVMLPLSCPRTMKPLAKFSFVSVLSIVFLVLVVIYLYFSCANPHPSEDTSFYTNWIEIRWGFIESLGTFVFTFVCQHTVNLAYESLPQSIQTPQTWRKVSTYSITLATESSLAIGIFAYLTFGSQTPADVLMGYPSDLTLANIARLLLCLTMILTFPLPFLTCREMMVLILTDAHEFYHTNNLQRYNICRPFYRGYRIIRRKLRTFIFKRNESSQQQPNNADADDEDEPTVEMQEPRTRSAPWWKLTRGRSQAVDDDLKDEWWDGVNEALLSARDEIVTSIGGENRTRKISVSPLSSPASSVSSELSAESTTTNPVAVVPAPRWLLPKSNGRQLVLIWHASLTYFLWIVVTVCAIKSPSLGDVLDLVGAFTGTLLAFILPALFSFKLRGHSRQSLLILVVGGVVGLLGTATSFVKFIKDA